MNDIRYLLDENVNPVIRTELLKREPKLVVWKVGDPGAPSKGATDLEILRWCEQNSFILVTYNRKTVPGYLKEYIDNGGHVPGIFELNPDMSIGETVDELLLIWGASDVDEFRDLIIYLPVS